MSYFSHLKRVKAKRLEIAELDKEISKLYERKSSLELEVQKNESELEILTLKKEAQLKELDKIKSLLTLNEQVENANKTLTLLNTEVMEEKESLEKLKRENSILQDCILCDELSKKFSVELHTTLDSTLQRLYSVYPKIKPTKLNILKEFNGFKDDRIEFLDIEIAIENNLTKFAISHGIDPTLYKDLMYSFNSSWCKRFKQLKKAYTRLSIHDDENDQLFNGFIVLTDESK